MALKFQRWKLSGELSPNQYDDNSCIITITGLPAGWSWEAFLNHGESLDVIPLELDVSGTIAQTTLKKEQLAFSGLYTIQLRGKKEKITQHTNKLGFTVGASFSEAAHWPEIPDAFNKYVQSVSETLKGSLDIPGAVEEYLNKNPITFTEKDPTVPEWAKTETKPAYSADEVGAIAESELQTAINTALAQAKASGEFDGADGQPGANGAPGADGKSAYAYAVEGGYTGTEAEFAAKLAEELPDKLPNPKRLTFTGAVTGTYDGSAAVTVDIPSGGGGTTGGGETWRLVQDITLETDDVGTIEFTTDSDGKALNLKKFALIGKAKASAAASTYITINGKSFLSNVSPYQSYNLRPFQFQGDFCKGFLTLQLVGAINSAINGVSMYTHIYSGNFSTSALEKIEGSGLTQLKISPQTATVTFSTGSHVELWGVDA